MIITKAFSCSVLNSSQSSVLSLHSKLPTFSTSVAYSINRGSMSVNRKFSLSQLDSMSFKEKLDNTNESSLNIFGLCFLFSGERYEIFNKDITPLSLITSCTSFLRSYEIINQEGFVPKTHKKSMICVAIKEHLKSCGVMVKSIGNNNNTYQLWYNTSDTLESAFSPLNIALTLPRTCFSVSLKLYRVFADWFIPNRALKTHKH